MTPNQSALVSRMDGRHKLVEEHRRLLRHDFGLNATPAPSHEAVEDFLEAECRLAAFLGDDLAGAVRRTEMNRWFMFTGRCATCGEVDFEPRSGAFFVNMLRLTLDELVNDPLQAAHLPLGDAIALLARAAGVCELLRLHVQTALGRARVP